jgi:hypothetical protein
MNRILIKINYILIKLKVNIYFFFLNSKKKKNYQIFNLKLFFSKKENIRLPVGYLIIRILRDK